MIGTNKMKKLLFLIVIFAVIFLGSPLFRLYQWKQAFESKDVEVISQAINYDKLKKNINDQLVKRLQETIDKNPIIKKLGADQLGSKIISDALDGSLNPTNISEIVRTEGKSINKDTKKLASIWFFSNDQLDKKQLLQDMLLRNGKIEVALENQVVEITTEQASKNDDKLSESKPSFKYCGLHCFEISAEVKGYPITVEMERENLINWKIINVELP